MAFYTDLESLEEHHPSPHPASQDKASQGQMLASARVWNYCSSVFNIYFFPLNKKSNGPELYPEQEK